MRGRRAWVVLGLALVAGLLATLLAARWLVGRSAYAVAPVVVAARDLEPGQQLDASMLTVQPWPGTSLPEGASGDAAMLQSRVTRSALVRGEPVLEGKLAPVGARGGLSAVIMPGRRAMTVRVNEIVGVAGFALPGNFVDVLVSAQDDGTRSQMVSRTVLERILVLAIAQEATRDETRPKVVSAVTLEVTPDQAERLDLARNIGQLSLVLRNQSDRAPALASGVTKSDLLRVAGERPKPEMAVPAPVSNRAPARSLPAPVPLTAGVPVTPARTGVQVEIIRGVLRSSTVFEEGEKP